MDPIFEVLRQIPEPYLTVVKLSLMSLAFNEGVKLARIIYENL